MLLLEKTQAMLHYHTSCVLMISDYEWTEEILEKCTVREKTKNHYGLLENNQ